MFGVEMWERFSFYGMQGILLIYRYYSATQGGLGMDETVAAGIVGAYGGAVTTKLAPEAFHTQMVALFFLSVSLGTAIAGQLARLYSPDDEAPYFATLGLIGVAVGVLLLLFTKPVLTLMKGVR